MFSFFKKKPKINIFNVLQADMHSHLIPGIDDGSPDMATSLAFLATFQELGYRKVITTPHILSGLYDNNTEIIQTGLKELQKNAVDQGLTIEVEAAAEYFVDRHFEALLEKGDFLSFGTAKYVLIEMSFAALSPQLEQVIFKLQTHGYQPVLAHPERYSYWHSSSKIFPYLKELGCYFQVNLPSLWGHHGGPAHKTALHLIKSDWVELLGTDLHHDKHLEFLVKNQYNSEIAQLLQKHPVKNHLL